ncbi:MAG: hypothetical protein LBO63_02860 [Oscillospiraceae bacterium]|jgi:hypothetical protein|nr:hypothetical protein [Oscillospiraceae bacterium]
MRLFISKTRVGIKAYLGNKEETYNRILLFAGVSVLLNAAIGIGKTVMGFHSHSFIFVCGGFYNVCLALAKIAAVKGYAESKGKRIWPLTRNIGKKTPEASKRNEYRCFRQVGFIVLAASLVYTAGSIGVLLFGRYNAGYSVILVIEIGVITAIELIASVIGVAAGRRDKEPILEAIKTTSLISSLIGLVLVQTAILGHSGTQPIVYFDYAGVALGAVSVCIGVYMVTGKRQRR